MPEQTKGSKLPLPILKINKNFEILAQSNESKSLFGHSHSLLDFIDQESHSKLRNWLKLENKQVKMEINVMDQNQNLLLVDLYAGWVSELHAEIVIVKKDEAFSKVMDQLTRLRTRLQDTNMELMHEKERLEVAMQENHKLSSPFIRLTKNKALIPMYGYIDQQKMMAVSDNLLTEVYQHDSDLAIFDLTAVRGIHSDGATLLHQLFLSMNVTGVQIMIVGANPTLVKSLHKLDFQDWDIRFVHSLESVLKGIAVDE